MNGVLEVLGVLGVLGVQGCGGAAPEQAKALRPSILLVTLDTTRADAIGRIHQNARYVPQSATLLAGALQRAGYRTAAFVSAFVLARRFGLARGFDAYDDTMPTGRNKRSARETTDAAIAWLGTSPSKPCFVWVHYYDPHAPYTPSYLDEVRFMDEHMGRLIAAFEQSGASPAIVIAGDHGEALGEHGEAEHGRLMYQSTMRVPLLLSSKKAGNGDAITRRCWRGPRRRGVRLRS